MYYKIQPLVNTSSKYYDKEALSLIRNMQSLGMEPTGRLTNDRQTLQMAEYAKAKDTLSLSNTQRLENATTSFDSMVSPQNVEETHSVAQTALTNEVAQMQATKQTGSTNNNEMQVEAIQRTGATQLGKENKVMHGLAA